MSHKAETTQAETMLNFKPWKFAALDAGGNASA
jgi:hypothetical protein